MANIKNLLKELENAKKKWELSSDDLSFLSNLWDANITTRLDIDVNNEELNKIWKNYSDNAYSTATKKRELEYDTANKLWNIETASSNIKEARSDDTRQELLWNTSDYKTKQDERYKQVQDIIDTQKRIANRQANIEVANAWRYWDIYSDSTIQNIKNDTINRYWQNILNAMNTALSNNRQIDSDILNVWLTEVNDKNTRDAYKDALLDKNNSYILDAIKLARDWDKKAIEDVENFFQSAVRTRWENTLTRDEQSQRREFYEKEFASLSPEWKAQMLADFSSNVAWYSLVADYIPRMVENYPNLSLSELVWKMTKVWEYALSWKQLAEQFATINPEYLTDNQKDLLDMFSVKWYTYTNDADQTYPTTIDRNNRNVSERDWTNYTFSTTTDNNQVRTENANKRALNERNWLYDTNEWIYDKNTWLYANAENNTAKTDLLNNVLNNQTDSSNVTKKVTLSEYVKDENNKKKIQTIRDNYMNKNINLTEFDITELSNRLWVNRNDVKALVDYLKAQKWN